jgi:hypothetical protein
MVGMANYERERERERERVCDFVTAAVLCRAGVKIK